MYLHGQADCASYDGEGYGVDIGPLAVGDFHNEIANAKTFLWNGPMGILEMPRYALGESTRRPPSLTTPDSCVLARSRLSI